jgi:hypothetical protein
VLVNILVAALTHTYDMLVSQLSERSAAIRVAMIKKFQAKRAMPAPLNLVLLLFDLVVRLCNFGSKGSWFRCIAHLSRYEGRGEGGQQLREKWTIQRQTNSFHNLKDAVRRYEERQHDVLTGSIPTGTMMNTVYNTTSDSNKRRGE